MSDYKVTDSELIGIANAIRTKGRTSAPLVFPNGFTTAIDAIPTGGGSQNILGGTAAPTSDVGSDGDIYIQYTDYSTSLDEYTPVEYIATGSTAGAYINTQVNGGSTKYFEVDFKYDVLPSSAKCVFGSWISNGDTQIFSESTNFGISVGGTYYRPQADTNRHSILANSNGLFFDNVKVIDNLNWNNVPNVMYGLFCRNNGNTFDISSPNLRIYGCKIWDGTIMIRNFAPIVKNSDETVGMYDLVNRVFYTNAGTQQFIAGEEIEISGKPINIAYLKVNGSWILLEDGDWDDVN